MKWAESTLDLPWAWHAGQNEHSNENRLVCGQDIEIIKIVQLSLKTICGRFPIMMNERISQQRLLAAYINCVGELMKSSELPSELPEKLCAEQAAKTPLQPLAGSCDAKKRDSRISGFRSQRAACRSLPQHSQGLGTAAPATRTPADLLGCQCSLCSDSVERQIKIIFLIKTWDEGASGKRPRMDFRLPKTEELVTLQASGLRVVTRKKSTFSESSGVIERHGNQTQLLANSLC